MAEQELKLKVGELTGREDFGRGIVRLDTNTMKKVGVKEGDVVEIEGKIKSGAVAIRSYPADIGLNIIRMDGLVRKNCDASIGEYVKIRKSEVKEAKKVTLAPAQKGLMLHFSPNLLKQNLFMRPMNKGDIIITNPVFKTRKNHDDVFSQFFGVDIEEVFFPMGAETRLVVVKTAPDGITQITDMTEVELLPEAVEVQAARLPEVTYEDVGGLGEIVPKIREMIELPLRRPEVFERLGVESPKGVLLHGSPGTGKTLIAKAVANESGANFISVAGPEFMSKFYGESEENLRRIFDEAEKNAPSIIFIDEIDAIAPKREQVTGEVERRVVSTLLTQMDGLKSRGKVIVIAATNLPNMLDPALRRTGRFDREIEIPIPDKKGRKEILQIHTRRMPLEKDVDLDKLSEITYGYVGADIAGLAKEAAMHALRRVIPEITSLKEEEQIPKEVLEKLKVTKEDFDYALRMVPPSAMREVLVEIPKVKWEDVGGLEDVKESLKEAVEWPLKDPECFKRIGIKPPKGILLYGPPGVGKTYIIKALANEAGVNLVAVKGPEILCVAGDTPVLTSFCGLRTIENLYENISSSSEIEFRNKDMEVRKLTKPIFSFGFKNGKIVKTHIKRACKIYTPFTYKIDLSDGNRVIVSKNQPFLTFRDRKIVWIKSDELEVGEFVAKPAQIPIFNRSVKLEIPKCEWLEKIKEDENFYYVKIKTSKTIDRLPKTLNKDFAEFLGWFVSEGNISKNCVSICNKNEEFRKRIIELFEMFVSRERIKEYKDRVCIYSIPLIKFLEKIFGTKLEAKSSKIYVPGDIFKTDITTIKKFLKSLYDGDGTMDNSQISYGSRSRKLTQNITYLLALLGIKCKYWERKDGMYMVTVTGKKEINKFLSFVYGKKGVEEIRRHYNAKYAMPDVSTLLRMAKEELGMSYYKDRDVPEGLIEGIINKRKRCGLIRLQRIMRYIDKKATPEFKNSEIYKSLKIISEGNLSWTKVIRKIKDKPQWMFDIETTSSSFIGGHIPLLLHNTMWVGESERKLRDIFRRAKQVAPSIILFDEIDALAPKRGIEMGARVTEQVVSQLLTEMSGIEEMEGVVIIATTNRPDIIDPALLRPGRFDRLIYVPSPDEKTRLEIFKVHTRDMPLKGVSLEKLAKETDCYSGADIEALAREAALFALREDKKAKEITMKQFEKALKKIKPSITEDLTTKYQKAVDDLKKNKMDDARYIG